MRIWKYFFLIFLFLFPIGFAQNLPLMPMIISGNVTINRKPAPLGTTIIAKIDDKIVSNFTVVHKGVYVLTIQGNENDIGKPIRFYVNGICEKKTLTFEPGEIKENFNLEVRRIPILYIVAGSAIIILCGVSLKKVKSSLKL